MAATMYITVYIDIQFFIKKYAAASKDILTQVLA